MTSHDQAFDALVEELLNKYARILGIVGMPAPSVVVLDALQSNALSICRWNELEPDTTTIEVQSSIAEEPEALERVIAHEMIHHQDFLEAKPSQRAKMGASLAGGHGRKFLEKAEIINQIMGAGYVTVKTDDTY